MSEAFICDHVRCGAWCSTGELQAEFAGGLFARGRLWWHSLPQPQ